MITTNDKLEIERVFWYEIVGRNDLGCTNPETHEAGMCANTVCVIAEIDDDSEDSDASLGGD